MRATFFIDCLPVRDLNLQRATDPEIFAAARGANVVVLTKDADFVELLEKHGPPPQVVLVTCGNTSNARGTQAACKSAVGFGCCSDALPRQRRRFLQSRFEESEHDAHVQEGDLWVRSRGLVFVVSACGDSSTSSGTTSPSPTVANGDF